MILDSCALLWIAHDKDRISSSTLRLIQENPGIYISTATCFEIALKHSIGKLKLPCSPETWIRGLLDFYKFSLVDLNMEICIKAAELPLIHKDPCDRFIIATALLKNLPVVTADRRFAEYGVKILI